jgi:hypothetical protein
MNRFLNNKNVLYTILFFGVIFNFFMTPDKVIEVRKWNSFNDSIVKQVVRIEQETVIERAVKFLKNKPQTITAFPCPVSAGGIHDYYSEGPYWWPDPANPKGPFIRKDGLRNPENFGKHDNAIKNFSWIVGTHTSAYLLTREEKFVKAAMKHLKAWFVDTATLMNPNMIYSQAIQGICTGRGVGIIDANSLIEVAQSVRLLEKSPYVSARDIFQIKEWFNQFISWLTTHQYGIDEMNAKNNHGTWWLAQVSTYAKLVGNKEVLKNCRDRYMNILLPNQMAADGSFPLEIERTKPYSYSLFNLDAMALIAWTLSNESYDVWNFSLPDGRGLKKGLEFMMPYIIDIRKWPYSRDVSDWDKQPGQRPFMLFAALVQNSPDLFSLWKAIGDKYPDDESGRTQTLKNPLLWIELNNSNLNQ